MTKELIKRVAEDLDVTKTDAKAIVQAVLNAIEEETVNDTDGNLRLRNFGSFQRIHRFARKGRNPKTGEEIEIAPKTIVKFVPSKDFAEKVKDRTGKNQK